MSKMKIAVVYGGSSSEREISLLSGKHVLENLDSEKYEAIAIEIDAKKRWVLQGKDGETRFLNIWDTQTGRSDLTDLGLDLVFLALHGSDGEDGKIQALLEMAGVKHTGSRVLASSLGMNKSKCSQILEKFGVQVPATLFYRENEDLKQLKAEVKEKLSYPCIVKPNDSGSSVGVSLVENAEHLEEALSQALLESPLVLIQELILGRELTCPVLGNEQEAVALPVGEIAHKGKFFDYQAKYNSKETEEIFPAQMEEFIILQVQKLSQEIFQVLGCAGVARCDFILSLEDDQLYFLEINTVPGMAGSTSLTLKAAAAAGLTTGQILDKIIQTA